MNKTMTGGIAVCAVISTVFLANLRSAAPTMVTVSMQRVAAESTFGKRLSQQLDSLRQERGRGLAAKQKELEEVVRQLAKPDTLEAVERDRLSKEESRLRGEFQRLGQQAQADFQSTQARLQNELKGHIAPTLAEVASRYSADVVLNSDVAVAWSAPGTDTTDEVIRRLNSAP